MHDIFILCQFGNIQKLTILLVDCLFEGFHIGFYYTSCNNNYYYDCTKYTKVMHEFIIYDVTKLIRCQTVTLGRKDDQ